MADDADRSKHLEDQYLERIAADIRAARGIKSEPALDCRVCGETLQTHRGDYGICWSCQSRIEANERRLRRG